MSFSNALKQESKLLDSSGKSEIFLLRSLTHFMLKNKEHSLSDLKQALKLNPRSFKTHLVFSCYYVWDNEYELALSHINNAIKIKPDVHDVIYLKAIIYALMGRFNEALKYCNNEIERFSDNAYAFYARGIIYMIHGDIDKALADIDRAIEISPKEDKLYLLRGVQYALLGDFDHAIADIKYSKNSFRLAAWADETIVGIFMLKGDYKQAIDYCNERIQQDPKVAARYALRGAVYSDKDIYDKALSDYNMAIKMAPNNAEYYTLRGELYYYKNSYKDAIPDLKKAIELDNRAVDAYGYLGQIYKSKGNYDLAIYNFTTALKEEPNEFFYSGRGISYLKIGYYDRSIADFNSAIALLSKANTDSVIFNFISKVQIFSGLQNSLYINKKAQNELLRTLLELREIAMELKIGPPNEKLNFKFSVKEYLNKFKLSTKWNK